MPIFQGLRQEDIEELQISNAICSIKVCQKEFKNQIIFKSYGVCIEKSKAKN